MRVPVTIFRTMRSHTITVVGLVAVLSMILSACSLPVRQATPDPRLVGTIVAQTANAEATRLSMDTAIVEVTKSAPTATQAEPTKAEPTLAPQPTATLAPTNTAAPTIAPTNTAVPVQPTKTPVPVPCNWALYVTDVTIPDNTSFSPGVKFTKTWRIKNIGTCTWSTSYALVFASGDLMGGNKVVALKAAVAPNTSVDLSVDLIAPDKNGTYQGNWMLRDGNGKVFGIGPNTDMAFWVVIKVIQSTVLYNFADNVCKAEWASSTVTVACAGAPGTAGAVNKIDSPDLEIGKEDEATLQVIPEQVNNGVLNGTYPAIDIKKGDRFKAVIGCWKDATDCNMVFQLNYRIGSGAIQNLGSWTETYDGNARRLDIDLSSLEGKNVTFILTITANGAHTDDIGFWLMPRIIR